MTVLLLLFLFLYVVVSGADYAIDYLNHRYLLKHGKTVPPEFAGILDEELLKKTTDYTVEKYKFGTVLSVFDQALALVFIFGGVLMWYDGRISGLGYPFVLSGIVYFIVLSWIKSGMEIPFDLYGDFKIENKYGFNNMTFRLWLGDFVKGLLISAVIMSILCGAAFYLIQELPLHWWLAVWLFFFIFSIFIMYISPYVLEPLFNKFTPVDDSELENRIKELLAKTGIKVSKVFKMDASRRTKHTNAYFSGIGHVKRIVLYDTLLEKLNHDEILAVLAHEAGHWKKKHVLKNLILFEILSLCGAYAAFKVLESDLLPGMFMVGGVSFFTKLVLLGFVSSVILWPVSPLFNMLSRRFENQADDFAAELGTGKSLATALAKLSKDNLSNLHPHPLYAMIHYSHPPAVLRIRRLNKMTGQNK